MVDSEVTITTPTGYLPARRRWIRVLLSSLRCFFFAMRLRRFLMTEPTDDLSSWPARRRATMLNGCGGPRAAAPPTGAAYRPGADAASRAQNLPGLNIGPLQEGVDRLLRDPESVPQAHRLQLAGMDQPVHAHLRDSHDLGDLRHGQQVQTRADRHGLVHWSHPLGRGPVLRLMLTAVGASTRTSAGRSRSYLGVSRLALASGRG